MYYKRKHDHMNRLYALCIAAAAVGILSTDTAAAQEHTTTHDSDIRARVEAGLDYSPLKNLSIEASLQMRLSDDISQVDRLHTSVGVQYKICPYFKIGADYILINRRDTELSSWRKPRHRLNVNLTASYRIGRVELALRERVQTTFRTDSVNRYEASDPQLLLRSRLSATWDIRSSKWSPYLLCELYNTLNAPAAVSNYLTDSYSHDNYVYRIRGGAGVKYKISKSNRLNIYYYLDYCREFDIDYKSNRGDLKGYVLEKSIRHIFGISYTFKL